MVLIFLSANATVLIKLIFILTFGVFVEKLRYGIKLVSRMDNKSCICLIKKCS